MDTKTNNLFESFFTEVNENKIQVTCLGKKFNNDDERRAYFRKELRTILQDPEIRKIEGFPKGDDDSIISLSDPPYFTVCPNPWIKNFISSWGTINNENIEYYHREPFSSDVNEGKNELLYNIHTYHTKVPHKAIMRYILHYTKPGDIVLDGFCGTGMTGVAAELCGNINEIQSLGYSIKPDGTILQKNIDQDGNNEFVPFSLVGKRNSILCDLSPVATFISNNYCDLSNISSFVKESLEVLETAEHNLKWLYEFNQNEKVLSSIWSDVFICPNCSNEIIYWDCAVKNEKIEESFHCPHCGIILGKKASKTTGAVKLERSFTNEYDPIIGKIVKIPKLVLVEQTTIQDKIKKKYKLTNEDRIRYSLLFKDIKWPKIPKDIFFNGRQTNKLINGSGISYLVHMYTKRALFAYGYLWNLNLSTSRRTDLFKFCLSAINNYISRKQGYFGGGGGVSGTLFTPSIHLERNIFDVLKRKIKKLESLTIETHRAGTVSTQSVTDLRNIPISSIDYIFTDPPFGDSLQYAELNMFVEAWLGTKTAVENDCVLNYVHKKDLTFYTKTMSNAFKEYFRVLKPGRWITIEFHNSQNSVWSAIQLAIESSGFIVADVHVLNKKQLSFNAINRAGAINQDLVISAYKPTDGLVRKFEIGAGTEDVVWDFVRAHLNQLPVFVSKEGKVEIISERQNFLLFDRMVAFHIQRGISIPLSASEFYQGLNQRFIERDGMYFLPNQIAEYDRRRMSAHQILQLQLFITDEKSSIQWLRQQLLKKPQTSGELKPKYMQEIGGWLKTEKLIELDELLEQNFIKFDGSGKVPEQIHSYLSSNWKELRNLSKEDPVLLEKAKDRWYVPDPNKANDLEKMREKFLLKEFEQYKKLKNNLKVFRLEAVRAGFKKAWQNHDYEDIINVANKMPSNVLEEDSKLLMWYDQAITRVGEIK